MKETDNLPKFDRYQRYYSTHKFWARIKHLGSKAGEQIVYNALLLHYVLKSPDVSVKNKGLIIGALGYLILPVDLIPDAIPMLGFTDDLSAIYFVIQTVQSNITPEIKKRAELKTKQILNIS